MKHYAYLVGGAALFVTDAEESPGEGWIDAPESVDNGDRYENGQWLKPGQTQAEVRERCERELTESDKRVTRALEESGSVPLSLKQHREALRIIYRSGAAPEEWPQIPAYDAKEE